MSEPRAVDLRLLADARGWLMATDRAMAGMAVAYAYATCCLPGAVKAWHRHKAHADRLMCVHGLARIVACKTELRCEPEWFREQPQEYLLPAGLSQFVVGPLAPKLVVVPPGWWHGFEALGGEPCVVVNCPDLPYDPADEERLDPGAIPFGWGEAGG